MNEVAEQALKHHKHLPKGTRQIFKIDARGQVVTPSLRDKITNGILSKTNRLIKSEDIRFIVGGK